MWIYIYIHVLFRDSQETLGDLSPERKAQIQKEDNAR